MTESREARQRGTEALLHLQAENELQRFRNAQGSSPDLHDLTLWFGGLIGMSPMQISKLNLGEEK